MKMKKLCITDTIHREDRQHTEWEKISSNHIPDKGLTSRIYSKLLKLNSKKKSIQKWMANGNLLYSSGNPNRGSVSTQRGGRWEGVSKRRGYMYTYG